MSWMTANGAHKTAAACYGSLVKGAAPVAASLARQAAVPRHRPGLARLASSTSSASTGAPAKTAVPPAEPVDTATTVPKSRFATRHATTPTLGAGESAAAAASQEEALAELRRLRLAARQATSSPPPAMVASSTSSSASSSTASSAPPRARPTINAATSSTPSSTSSTSSPSPPPEPPIDIRQTPQYKKAMRQWVSLIVGLPVFIVTSYYLFDRLALGNMPTALQDYRDKMAAEAEKTALAAAETARRLESGQPPAWEGEESEKK